jgi:hypothetical protein
VRIVRFLALAAAWAGQVGCGSGTGAGSQLGGCDGGCPQLTPADDAFVTSYCTKIEACCVVNNYRMAPDVAACKAQLAKNGFSRDPAVQSACLSELQDLASGGAVCHPKVADLGDPCVRLHYEPSGSKGPGEPCTAAGECAGAAGSITLCIGGCVQMARGKAGDGVCMGDASDDGVIIAAPISQPNTSQQIFKGVLCERRAGLYCSFESDQRLNTCQPLRAGGAACNYSRSCASARCYGGDSTDGTAVGACHPIVSAGQQCLDNFGVCDEASYCDSSVSPAVCAPRSPAGSTCTSMEMCSSDSCTTDGRCTTNGFWDDAGFCARSSL